MLQALSARDDVDAGVAPKKRVALLLGDAAGDRHEWTFRTAGRHVADFTETRVQFLLRPLANAARIDQEDVGCVLVM